MARILITGVGGPAGVALARQLSGHHLIGVDFADLAHHPVAALLSEVHRGPSASDLALVPFLRRLVADSCVDLVIPTVQDELPAIAAAAAHLGAPVVSAPSHGVALAHDKLLTAWALAAAGVAVPATVAGEDLDPSALPPFPFVVKPRVSRGGRGVRVVDDAADLAAVVADGLGGQMVQHFAPGQEYAVQVYREAGRPPAEVVVLRKTALKQGRVGNAAGVERCAAGVAADVADVAARAIRALDVVGPSDVDVRRLADGSPVVLEVNARFGANSEHVPELLERVLARHLATPAVGVR